MCSSLLPASAVIIVLSWQLIHGASYVNGKTNQVEDDGPRTLQETATDENSDIETAKASTATNKSIQNRNQSQETTECPEEISNQNEADWEDPCTLSGDGFYPNYTSSCQQYYRCENHQLVSTHTCKAYTAFSTSLQECITSTEVACIEPQCPTESPGIDVTFITPGTQCRAFHLCGSHGQRGDHLCPQGHVYDRISKKCRPTPWMCREPICTGRVDGNYADSSEDCRRSFCCRGGHLTSVAPCPQGQLYGPPCLPAHLVACPPPSSSAAPIIIGSNNRPTKPQAPTFAGPCSLLQDGMYRNFSGDPCRDYFRCSNRKVMSIHSCPARTSLILIPTGNPSAAACLSSSLLVCLNLRPEGHPACGPVPGSNCGRHVECEPRGGGEGRAVLLACPEGRTFDGHRCVLPSDAPICKEGIHPLPNSSPCAGKPDGYHADPGSPSCRGYIYCGGGHSISYICPRGYAFNGEQCAPAEEVNCQFHSKTEDKACAGMWAGYVADTSSGCQSYFYCQAGDHITTLSCPRDQIFDGRRCVPGTNCTPDYGGCGNLPDGHYPDINSECKEYFRCAAGFRVENLSCPEGRGFDGRACVDAGLLSCSPQSFIATSIIVESPCQTGNGFFQDLESGCHRYYYCIDGERTWLSCQGNEIFDGQVCVPAGTYTCPTTPSPCTSSNCNKYLRVQRVFATVLGKSVFVNSLRQLSVQKTSSTKVL